MRRGVLLIGAALLGLIVVCMAAPQPVARDLAYTTVALATLGLALFMGAWLHEAQRHHRVTKEMSRLARQGAVAGQPVRFVSGLSTPVVAGLWFPRVYCGEDLTALLDGDELLAVMLHERHHQRGHAPLRLTALSALAPFVDRTESGRAWLERARAQIEIAADAYALAGGVSRAAIASSLLKLTPGFGSASAPGFATAADLRVRALLGDPTGLPLAHRAGQTVSTLLLVSACLLVYLA